MITFSRLGQYGRLGNQLFQLSAAIGLALRNNDKFIFPNWEYEPHFNLHGCFNKFVPFRNEYHEPQFAYTEIEYKPNMSLHGYFQSEKYFADCKDYIRNVFTPKYYADPRLLRNVASIHVRRTDYLIHKDCYEILSLPYYEEAMERTGASNFLIFSDDIDWCRLAFKGDKFIFSNQPEYEDLAIMMTCQHNIIANSSFSWWAAWLNPNPDKKVIAPKNWFGPKLSPTHPTDDLIPDSWIRI